MKPDEIKPFAVNMFEKSLSFKDGSGLTLSREQVLTSDDEGDDHEAPKIKRNKFKTFLKKFVDIPGTQTIPQAEAPSVPAEVVSNYNDIYLEAIGEAVGEDDNDIALEGFADALDEFQVQFS